MVPLNYRDPRNGIGEREAATVGREFKFTADLKPIVT
jgi:hypothetical protein